MLRGIKWREISFEKMVVGYSFGIVFVDAGLDQQAVGFDFS